MGELIPIVFLGIINMFTPSIIDHVRDSFKADVCTFQIKKTKSGLIIRWYSALIFYASLSTLSISVVSAIYLRKFQLKINISPWTIAFIFALFLIYWFLYIALSSVTLLECKLHNIAKCLYVAVSISPIIVFIFAGKQVVLHFNRILLK